MATLITTAKLNGVDPQAWLVDVLSRTAELPSDVPLNFHPALIRASTVLLRYHSLDRRMLEFPAFVTMAGWQRHRI